VDRLRLGHRHFISKLQLPRSLSHSDHPLLPYIVFEVVRLRVDVVAIAGHADALVAVLGLEVLPAHAKGIGSVANVEALALAVRGRVDIDFAAVASITDKTTSRDVGEGKHFLGGVVVEALVLPHVVGFFAMLERAVVVLEAVELDVEVPSGDGGGTSGQNGGEFGESEHLGVASQLPLTECGQGTLGTCII